MVIPCASHKLGSLAMLEVGVTRSQAHVPCRLRSAARRSTRDGFLVDQGTSSSLGSQQSRFCRRTRAVTRLPTLLGP